MRIQTISGQDWGPLKSLLDEMNGETRLCDVVMVHHKEGVVSASDIKSLSQSTRNLHVATSCRGAMSNTGASDVVGMVFSDPEGDYGSYAMPFGDNPRKATFDTVTTAIERAQRVGEAPDLIILSATPGAEEEVLMGIEDAVGPSVPVIGGSAADEAVAGGWRVSDGGEAIDAGLVVTVMFSSTPVEIAYQNGYEPTQHSGIVTKTDGRCLIKIDGEPAADVYAKWNGGEIIKPNDDGEKSILSDATMWPLGRQVSTVRGIPFYLLAHPSVVHENGNIDLFAELSEGEEIVQMTGTRDALVERGGRVAQMAKQNAAIQDEDIAGAFMIYCGGCMLSVADRIDEISGGVSDALKNAPFLGAFTFGEQGPMRAGGNRHGNLMISCVIFSKGD